MTRTVCTITLPSGLLCPTAEYAKGLCERHYKRRLYGSPDDNLPRDCPICEVTFTPRNAHAICCSTKCATKAYALRKQYGLTGHDVRRMLREQSYACLICETRIGFGTKEKNYLHIDHCHVTGGIRGLLCNRCNSGLGLFDDEPELLVRAARYVEAYREKSNV